MLRIVPFARMPRSLARFIFEEPMPHVHNFLSQLVGSFATPAAENPTVAMIEAAFAHHNIDARYINCEVAPADLGAAVRGAKAMGWLGFNCSIPHKVAVIAYLDALAESAATIGAVNCVVRRDGRLIGENTDGKGFVESLRTLVDPRDKKLTLFGAGGAARAIAVESALAGARAIAIVNRDPGRGAELAALLNEKTPARAEFVRWDKTHRIGEDSDILVNATSIGLFPDVEGRLDLDLSSLRPATIVADVIPNPPRTLLIRQAEALGCRTLDGLGMLVNQGVIGVKHWTGVDVAAGVMRKKLEELFGA
jgi:shikimate dehydrogenase